MKLTGYTLYVNYKLWAFVRVRKAKNQISVHQLRLKRAFAVRLLVGPGSIFNDIKFESF